MLLRFLRNHLIESLNDLQAVLHFRNLLVVDLLELIQLHSYLGPFFHEQFLVWDQVKPGLHFVLKVYCVQLRKLHVYFGFECLESILDPLENDLVLFLVLIIVCCLPQQFFKASLPVIFALIVGFTRLRQISLDLLLELIKLCIDVLRIHFQG